MPAETSRHRRSTASAHTTGDRRPINARITATLRDRIVEGVYEKTGSLPPELELMREFKVSRHTIRTALQKLVVDGLIERRRGTRTVIVARDPAAQTWSVGSLDKMVGAFYAADDRFVGIVPAADYPEMARLFGTGERGSLFKAIRVMRSPAGPVYYSTVFTRAEFGKRITRKRLASQYLLTLLEQHCGIRAARARQVVSAALPPIDVYQALDINEHRPVLALQLTFFDRSGEPIQHVLNYCHPDKHRQVVEFFRELAPSDR